MLPDLARLRKRDADGCDDSSCGSNEIEPFRAVGVAERPSHRADEVHQAKLEGPDEGDERRGVGGEIMLAVVVLEEAEAVDVAE